MRRILALAALAAVFAGGCGSPKTPEEIEAEKYPPVKPLTPEEERYARELGKTRPPEGSTTSP